LRRGHLSLCLPGAEPSGMCVADPRTLFPVGTRILWQVIAVLPREVVASDLMVYTVPVSDANGPPDVDGWLQKGDLLPTAARRQWLAKALQRLAGAAH
jgi:hypothetical protein